MGKILFWVPWAFPLAGGGRILCRAVWRCSRDGITGGHSRGGSLAAGGRCDQMPLAVRDALRTGKEERSDGPPKQEKSRMPPASKRVRENIRLLHEGARLRAARRRGSGIAAAAQGVGSSLRPCHSPWPGRPRAST